MGRKVGWFGLIAAPSLYFTTTTEFVASVIENTLAPQLHLQDYSAMFAGLTCAAGVAAIAGWGYVAANWLPEKQMIKDVNDSFAKKAKNSNRARGINTAIGVSAVAVPIVGTLIPPLAPFAYFYTGITGPTWGIRKTIQLSMAHRVNKEARQIRRDARKARKRIH